jgi:hypothetical protein
VSAVMASPVAMPYPKPDQWKVVLATKKGELPGPWNPGRPARQPSPSPNAKIPDQAAGSASLAMVSTSESAL